VLGSPAYMSPEQASGRPVTSASDVYSVGAILYEMLSGTVPHKAGSSHELLRMIADEPPAPITNHRTDLPPTLAGILSGMLARNPDDRPSAGAVEAELAGSLGQQPN